MAMNFSDSKNRVAADYSAFLRDWETSQQARNHPYPPERKWVVFAVCMYKCIACHYKKDGAETITLEDIDTALAEAGFGSDLVSFAVPIKDGVNDRFTPSFIYALV